MLNLVAQLANSQVAAGFDVSLIYSTRPETPPEEKLAVIFPPIITRINVPMVAQISPIRDCISLVKLIRLIIAIRPDVIHLHSSKAGVLGRVGAFLAGYRQQTFYSPHGFSFLKQDVSERKRRNFLLIEQIAAKLGGVLIASSATEAELARTKVKHKQVALVENSIELSKIVPKGQSNSEIIRIVTIGRISYPKAPSRFLALATRLSGEAVEFVWIGDGELRQQLYLGTNLPSNLSISGWMDREKVFGELPKFDIFVLLSLWEGMPLSLIEAQASGLPAIVFDVVGCRDVVINGETGFICSSMDDVVEKMQQLIHNDTLRMQMGLKAREMSLERFSADRMHREMLRAYRVALPN